MIGWFGDIAFFMSSFMGRTFRGFQKESKARYATHDILDAGQLLQFLGTDLSSVSLGMRFASDLVVRQGIDPRTELERLKDMLNKGTAHFLIIGPKPIGDYVIEDLSESWTRISARGILTAAGAEVKLREYA